MTEIKKIFIKAGGYRLIKQYINAHVLIFACIQGLLLGLSKKSLEILRLSVENKILKKLRKKYKKYVVEYMMQEEQEELKQTKSDIIWFCWFQGMDAAPEIVKVCYNSLKKNITNKRIIVITLQNYKEYVCLPEYIVEKYNKGIIGQAHFSDLLRLELLINYGGTWIDSTVLCSSDRIPSCMIESPLFVFQTLKPGLDGHATCISNWFITAYSNNKILRLVRALLYKYWMDNDVVIDYFIFHHFFQIAIEYYPEIWNKVFPYTNETPHILLLRLFDKYDGELFDSIMQQTCFHKLTYKFDAELENIPNSNYMHIINEYRS